MKLRISPPATVGGRVLASSTVALVCTLGAQEPDAGWMDRGRLEAGDVLFDYGGEARFRGLIRAAVLVEAPPEAIWEILKDCESAPDYVPHVVSCDLVETRDDGLTQVYRQEVKYAWFLPRFEHVFSLRYHPTERIDVERVSGPIEHMRGIWRLSPAGRRETLLAYELELEPGLPLPDFLVGASLRRDIPTVLAEVRRRAEAARQGAR